MAAKSCVFTLQSLKINKESTAKSWQTLTETEILWNSFSSHKKHKLSTKHNAIYTSSKPPFEQKVTNWGCTRGMHTTWAIMREGWSKCIQAEKDFYFVPLASAAECWFWEKKHTAGCEIVVSALSVRQEPRESLSFQRKNKRKQETCMLPVKGKKSNRELSAMGCEFSGL